jgi:LPXTG-site transpeptidase (sortase) family protein
LSVYEDSEPSGTVVEGDITSPIHIDPKLMADSPIQSPMPTRIIVPSLSIDLEVKPAVVRHGYWELSPSVASFGLGSAVPGENGNTVIFAHARKGLFLPLRQISEGARIYVLTAQKTHIYQVNKITKVNPTDTQVISPTSSEVLTLYTCTGFQDSLRLIVQATPIK